MNSQRLPATVPDPPSVLATAARPLDAPLPVYRLSALVSGDYGSEYVTLSQDHGHGHWRLFVHWPSTSLINCPRELLELGRRQAEFSALGALLIGVAGDTHSILHSWRAHGRQAGPLPYPIIDDRKQVWARAMLLALADASTITPSTVVVDPAGRIRLVQHHQRTSCRDVGELLNVLTRFKDAESAPAPPAALAAPHAV